MARLFIDKRNMKVKLTLAQLKRILETEQPKYPITIVMAGLDRDEVMEIAKILQSKKKG